MKKNKITSIFKFAAKFIFVVILMLSVSQISASAQVLVKMRRSDFRLEDKPGFKEAWKSLKLGVKFMEDGKGTYRLARENFLKAYKYNSYNPELNYLVGIAYLETDNKIEAIKYLKFAWENNEDVAVDILYQLGRAYHQILDFDRAIENYNNFKLSLSAKYRRKNPELLTHLNKLIEECRSGKDIVKTPKRVIINNLGSEINSLYDDYNAVVNPSDSIMFFTSRRPFSDNDKRIKLDNKFSEDIYYSHKKGKKWSTATAMNKPINSSKNEAIIGFNKNLSELYIYDGSDDGGSIKKSIFKKNKWRKPKKLKGPFNTKYQETSICFTSDGNTAYFISSRNKNSLGGKDVFYTYKSAKGNWIKPKNLGNTINTKYDEESLTLSEDDKVLYFSSKGHNTMGGYDVFKSVKNEYDEWQAPENMGYPINTPDDDLFFRMMPGEKFAYYTSIRESGLGEKDLYKIIFLGAEKEMAMTLSNQWLLFDNDTVKTIMLKRAELVAVDSGMVIKGKIFDNKTREGVRAKLEIIDLEASKVVATAISDTSGTFKVRVNESKTYGVEITAQSYLLLLDVINMGSQGAKIVFEKDFGLDKVEVGAKVILKNIFFEFSKSTLKPESYAELNNVVKLLESNPTMRIEISGHTDNVGSAKGNQKLSESRAQSVVQYLIAHGIETGRLESKGYGFEQPVAPNTTAQGREQNRRVEFKVLSK